MIDGICAGVSWGIPFEKMLADPVAEKFPSVLCALPPPWQFELALCTVLCCAAFSAARREVVASFRYFWERMVTAYQSMTPAASMVRVTWEKPRRRRRSR